ncbi:Uu.00g060940.m01.CDS01 [Anthostomella pinea]|uniref:Uu.00g060940.m01.CDS01 n=1 Tax=Anthostomella pinea TaxID=933095 RepID=A0AAI8VT11_9PEZI|nr:Uu.00g060940.m01.CDS01 [Anthostomella pinea]
MARGDEERARLAKANEQVRFKESDYLKHYLKIMKKRDSIIANAAEAASDHRIPEVLDRNRIFDQYIFDNWLPAKKFEQLCYQQQWPDLVKGQTLSLARFKELYDENPNTLFQEVKLRTFMLMASKDLFGELQKILATADTNLAVVREHALAFAEDLIKAKATITSPQSDKEKVNNRGVRIRSAARVAEDDTLIEQVNTQWDNIIKEKDKEIQLLREKVISMAGATTGSSQSSRSTWLSPKQKDPPVFTGNKPTAENNNANHFPTDDDKITYILGHLQGSASEGLMPFLEVDEATGFVKLAGQAKKEVSIWKEELFKRLPNRLNTACLDKYHDDEVDFKGFCKYVLRHDRQQRKNYLITQMRKTDTPKITQKPDAQKGNGGGLPQGPPQAPRQQPALGGFPSCQPSPGTVEHYNLPVLGTASDGQKMYAKPQLDQIKALIAKGQCFICHEHGHRSNDCSAKDDFEKQKEARINALSARLFDGANGGSIAAQIAALQSKDRP